VNPAHESAVAMLQANREALGSEVDGVIAFLKERPPLPLVGDLYLDAVREVVSVFVRLHQAHLEQAALAAENVGLRAKVAVLERERDAARARPAVADGPRCKAIPETLCDEHADCLSCSAYALWRETVRPPYEVGSRG